jgi:uncharacterized protein DUF6570
MVTNSYSNGEMLIARVHVHMIVKRFRGHQYQYSGHCVSFMQNEVNIFDELPTLPQDANILILQVTAREPDRRRAFSSEAPVSALILGCC